MGHQLELQVEVNMSVHRFASNLNQYSRYERVVLTKQGLSRQESNRYDNDN